MPNWNSKEQVHSSVKKEETVKVPSKDVIKEDKVLTDKKSSERT